jgi:hypothetical protein
MRVDDQIEPLVRRALTGAVDRNNDGLDTALQAFPDEASRLAGLHLIVAVCGMALIDLLGDKPSAVEVRVLAETIAELEEWSGITSAEVEKFLIAIADDVPLEQAGPVQRVVPLAFTVTASLLSGSPRPKGESWSDRLDWIEAAVRAKP